MKGVFYLSLFLFTIYFISPNELSAQWIQTNGPYGNSCRVFTQTGDTLIAGWNGGVFLSTDNGLSWKSRNIGLTEPYVTDLVVSGSNIYVSTIVGGIFISTDKCSSWRAINNGLTQLNAYKIVAKSPNLIVGTSNGIFRSIDNGANWTNINPGNNLNYLHVNALYYSSNSLFAATKYGVFRSDDNGTSWITANFGLADSTVYCFTECESDLFAATKLGIYRSTNNGNSWDEVNPISISSGTLSIVTKNNILFVGTYNDGVFRSIDHGTTWIPVNSGLISANVGFLSVIGNDIYATTPGGVFRSTDEGIYWNKVSNVGMSNTNISTIESVNFTLFAQTIENTLFSTEDYGIIWRSEDSGLTNKEIRKIIPSGTNYFAATDHGIFLSTNYGKTWIEVNQGLTNINVTGLCASGTYIFASTYGGGIFLSENNGMLWSPINRGIPYSYILDPSFTPIYGIFVNNILSNGDVTIFQANGDYDGIYRSENRGASWTRISFPVSNCKVNASAVIGSNFVLGTYGGILLSTDAGLSWTLINRNFQLSNCFAVNGTNLFAGTNNTGDNHTEDEGILLSTDLGATWTPINSGLQNIFITDLAKCGNFLFAGIRYGGVWRRSISEILTNIEKKDVNGSPGITLNQNYPNPFVTKTTISFSISSKSDVSLRLFDSSGREVTTLISEELGPGIYEKEWNLAGLQAGLYLCRLQVGSVGETRTLIKIP
jgi:photosystem II stability/assembly factor-like uncharacterized protein